MTNTELLQKAYMDAAENLTVSADNLLTAIIMMENANNIVNNLRTYGDIAMLKQLHVILECAAKQIPNIKFLPKIDDKKESQCENCDGTGKIRDIDDISDIPCPACDGSGVSVSQRNTNRN